MDLPVLPEYVLVCVLVCVELPDVPERCVSPVDVFPLDEILRSIVTGCPGFAVFSFDGMTELLRTVRLIVVERRVLVVELVVLPERCVVTD